MAAVCGYAKVLLLCVLLIRVTVTADEMAHHGSAARVDEQTRAPNGKLRQQVSIYRVISLRTDSLNFFSERYYTHLPNIFSMGWFSSAIFGKFQNKINQQYMYAINVNH
jgi:hypothetical protein